MAGSLSTAGIVVCRALFSSSRIETYAYSADGLRQQKQAGVTVTYFVGDEQNVLMEQ